MTLCLLQQSLVLYQLIVQILLVIRLKLWSLILSADSSLFKLPLLSVFWNLKLQVFPLSRQIFDIYYHSEVTYIIFSLYVLCTNCIEE